ncbi:MAG: DNA-directed RNA polymerase subunit omega [Clostridiales bacterium]|nr:DNA-directed RNA polymerase subunit omega [Clostridiales bacterium]
MYKTSVEDMLTGKRSRYALVIAVARRARAIAQGYIDNKEIMDEKPVLMALDEFKDGKFDIYEPEINE